MLSHSTPPTHGAAIIGDLVYEGIKIYNYNVEYINPSSSVLISDIGKYRGRKFQKILSTYFNLLSRLVVYRPDIIYVTPTVSGKGLYKDLIYFFIIRLIGYLIKKSRLVVHLHMRPHKAGWIKKNIIYNMLFRSAYLIMPSELLLGDYNLNMNGAEDVYFIPNYMYPICDKNLAIESVNKKYHLQNINKKTTINILYLGHLIESKGYRRGLEIAAKLIKKDNRYTFNFVGECGNKTDIKYFYHFINSNGLTGKIIYHGSVKGNEKHQKFVENDILIIPSYSEAYPLTILEALSIGMPIVATDTGAIREIIGHNHGAIVSQPESESKYVNDFVTSVLEIASKWNADMGIKSIAYYYDNWSEKNFINELINAVVGKSKNG